MTGYDLDAPGTVHLIDMDGSMIAEKNNDEVVLIPQPSSNPNDPLRWSKRKKNWQFGLLFFWAFMLAVAANFSGPLWTIWTEDLNCTFQELNVTTALLFLFLGLGCVFLQPLAMKIGRRAVYLACTIIVIVASILGATAKSVSLLYGSNILAGFAAAPVDSLVEISSTDVFFLHERSTVFSLLVLALYAGSNLGCVAAGYIVDTLTWQWCYYIQIIIFGVMFFVQVFVMEDTTFRRESVEESMQVIALRSEQAGALREIMSGEKSGPKSMALLDEQSVSLVDTNTLIRPYRKRMAIIQTDFNDKRSYFTIASKPFLLVTFPAVVWGGIVYGAQMMWLLLLSTTQSEILSAEPYNFSAATVGLSNVAPCVGSIVGMFYGGKFVDWLTLYLTKRNGGYMEPEFRLWAMIGTLLTNAGGLLAYGLGAVYGAHWAVPVIVGQGLLGFAMSASGPISMTYAVDSYERVGPECLVIMLFFRNIIGMVFCFVIQPWIDGCGLKVTTWLMFMLSVVINGSFLIMVKWGKSMRKWTRGRYERFSL